MATSLRTAAPWLVGTTVAVALLGLLAIAGRFLAGWSEQGLYSLLSLSYEGNLPTWHASVLAFACALLLFACAAGADRDRAAWRLLGAGFVAISADEIMGLHETLTGTFDAGGVLFYDWVIPAGLLVAALGAAFVPFLRRLPRETARRFVLAGALYVGGALGMELPLGAWAEQRGDDDPGYALLDWLEETLEIAGLTVFALTLVRRIAPDPPA